MKTRFFIMCFLLFTISLFAGNTMLQEVEPPTAMSVVEMITPLLVLGVTWLVRKVKPSIPGWATLIVVSAVSAAVTWVTNLAMQPDLSWMAQFLYGLLSVVIHQVYKQLTASQQ